ncbi:threonine/homoserine/homoserine lactone efflux protein [Brevundimonas nasdae]|jgi:threonine/homoserine/homoserine lactone efflux protein|uniref:hypothetical protein n=1 Tax=Brevundimonas nasdae TaxID=172043 RepID=UPI00191213F5|nr:hypothetical protein [Brevundimonas nasdae]MBK6023699.1 hypothetical protein [Brevundimonas nasdae]MDQ0450351.1 threonine/homoserine/homoserine lactone efflux protein [Brevundimonas nasdae]
MRLQTIQIVAGLASALAFVLAFMAAGAALTSGLFMLLGLAGLGWLAYSLIKTVLKRDRKAEPSARA